MTEELDRERVAVLAAKIFDNGSAAASGPLEFLAAIEVARTIALVTHRHAVPADEYRSFLACLAAVEAEFSGRGKELADEAGKIERGEIRYRCAACGHEDTIAKIICGSICRKCKSEDVFECGTPESDLEWEEAAKAHKEAMDHQQRQRFSGDYDD